MGDVGGVADRERYISNENNTLYVLYHINNNTNQIEIS